MTPARRVGAPPVVLGLLLAAVVILSAGVRPAAAAQAATPEPPAVRAPAAILVEPATGDVVYQRNARDERPIASTTKLMTALLTLERARLGEKLTAVPYHPAPAESVIGLRAAAWALA